MVRFPAYDLPTVKPHELSLGVCPFADYLQRTNRVETFVVTHRECYGYQVIDMVARGIRVVTPVGFLHHSVVDGFQLPTFRNQEELLAIVSSPVESRWATMINRCTDYSDVAKTILNGFRRL